MSPAPDTRVGVVLLAAGGSARLGSPKQLLVYEGKTLLRRAAETALAVGCPPVIVVLGRDAERMRAELAGLDVRTVDNPDWSQGMGTSVRPGVSALLETGAEAPEAALLMLCDQPLVTADALSRLVAAFRRTPGQEAIAAAAYDGTVGVPVVFARTYYEELLALPDDAGAKLILRRHAGNVVAVPMPEAAVDVDTREQYERLSGRHAPD